MDSEKNATPGATTVTVDGPGPSEPTLPSSDITDSGAVVDVASTRASRLPAPLQYRDPERYDVEGEHGRGGLGRVLLARDRELGRSIAIKELLHRSHVGELRFFREALITARLEHPAIVPVHEAGRWADGTPFYAMKFVAGRPLRELIRAASTDEERLTLVSHLLAVADAIAYAHSRRIIHRDLKPSNILVGAFGETVVIDWGLAKEIGSVDPPELADPASSASPPDLTQAGSVMGTPMYMSPEQASGAHVDERTDVYALGAILKEIYLGEPAVDRSRYGPMAAELISICKCALSPSPENRYATASGFAIDLRNYLSGGQVATHAYSLRQRLARLTRRHRSIVTAIVVALCCAVIFGAFYTASLVAQQKKTLHAMAATEAAVRALEGEKARLILQQSETSLSVDPTMSLAWLKSYRGTELRKAQELAAIAAARGYAARVVRPEHPPAGTFWLLHAPPVPALALLGGTILRPAGNDQWRTVATDVEASYPIAHSATTGLLIYTTKQGQIRAYDARTDMTSALGEMKPPTRALHLTSDNREMVLIDSAGILHAGSPAKGQLKSSRFPFEPRSSTLAAHLLFVCTKDHRLVAYDIATDSYRTVARVECSDEREAPLVADPYGKVIVAAVEKQTARVEMETGHVELLNTGSLSLGVASRNGAIVTTIDGSVYLIPFQRREPVLLHRSDNQPTAVSSDPASEHHAYVGFMDGSIARFDTGSGSGQFFKAHPRLVRSIAGGGTPGSFSSADAREFRTGTLALYSAWQVPTKATFHAGYTSPTSLFVDGQDGTISKLEDEAGSLSSTTTGSHGALAFGIAVDDLGRLLTAGWDGSVRRWRDDGTYSVMAKHDGNVRDFAVKNGNIASIDARAIHIAAGDGSARSVTPLSGSPSQVAFNGTVAVVIARDGGVHWVSRETTRGVGSHGTGRGDVAYISGLDRFVSTGRDGNLKTYSSQGEVLSTLKVSDDCGRVATGASSLVGLLCGGRDLAIVDIAKGTIYFQHTLSLDHYAIAFAPDGKYALISTMAGSVYVYSLDTLALAVAQGSDAAITSAIISPTGDEIVATSLSDRVFRWRFADLQFVPANPSAWLSSATTAVIGFQNQ